MPIFQPGEQAISEAIPPSLAEMPRIGRLRSCMLFAGIVAGSAGPGLFLDYLVTSRVASHMEVIAFSLDRAGFADQHALKAVIEVMFIENSVAAFAGSLLSSVIVRWLVRGSGELLPYASRLARRLVEACAATATVLSALSLLFVP